MCPEPGPTHYPAPFGVYPPVGGTDQPTGVGRLSPHAEVNLRGFIVGNHDHRMPEFEQ